MACLFRLAVPRPSCPLQENPVKLARALIAAAVALGAAVAVQMATTSGASAQVRHPDACGNCWYIIET